ncbi:siderophore-interacting protein [Herbaspirillum lusitanum]|uniref:Siderophore-interacting protein n=1 Tax=Herbaspirillum lusitanum TaxID=213312 RepID=A0ABW9AB19_9BURK
MSTSSTASTATRSPPRLLFVQRIENLSPGMRRITLGGAALAGFPENSDGAHIKLLLPREGQTVPLLPILGPSGPIWPSDELRPISRTYTVSRYDAGAAELDVDFVLHGDDGPASRWALHAGIGSAIGVAGPGGPSLYQPDADWYLLAGDMSSLPLICAVLRALPASACGHVLIEVPDMEEIRSLSLPDEMDAHWLVRGDVRPGASTLLTDSVCKIAWPRGRASITLAGENAQVIAIRNFLLRERRVSRAMMYAVPYWKDAHSEESYHAERHRIMDEMKSGAG